MNLPFLFALLLVMLLSSSEGDSSPISSAELDLKWQDFKTKFGKIYNDTSEEVARKKIFEKYLEKIDAHNKLYLDGLTSYAMDINEFSDMGDLEFKVTMASFSIQPLSNTSDAKISPPPKISAFRTLPQTVDWRAYGAVTPVKNQGACGSCYAFSATGALEGQYFLRTRRFVSLSEQQLIDCPSSLYRMFGCNGGWPVDAFKYIATTGGINAAVYYPYSGTKWQCRYRQTANAATCRSYMLFVNLSELQLQSVVASVGPLAVLVDSSQNSFRFYKTGIHDEPRCNSRNLNHAVLLVGYGTHPQTGQDYWIVKNSWGTSWGNSGYIYMARNKGNQCGIASEVSYPLV